MVGLPRLSPPPPSQRSSQDPRARFHRGRFEYRRLDLRVEQNLARRCAGPAQSPSSMVRPDTSMPSLRSCPPRAQLSAEYAPPGRVTVVLPLVPVTHTMGIGVSPAEKRVHDAYPRAGARPLRVPGAWQSRPGVDLNYDSAWSSSPCEMSLATRRPGHVSRRFLGRSAAWAAVLG